MRLLPTSIARCLCAIPLAVLPLAAVLDAQQPGPPAAAVAPANDYRAEDTRRELQQLLDQHPPAVRRVLQLDPSLLGDDRYLAAYPSLATLLAAHPEIARAPSYYVGTFEEARRTDDPRLRALDVWGDIAQNFIAFMVFLVVVASLGWLVRTLVDYRRWLRVSKVQADAHAKLLDRLTSNQDLAVYVQSPAGQSFLQSAPIPLDAGPRSIGAPMGRILLSVQAGVVLAFLGMGLQWTAARVGEEMGTPLSVLGILAVMLGLGFVASAVVAFVLARRLGLLESATPPPSIGSTRASTPTL